MYVCMSTSRPRSTKEDLVGNTAVDVPAVFDSGQCGAKGNVRGTCVREGAFYMGHQYQYGKKIAKMFNF